MIKTVKAGKGCWIVNGTEKISIDYDKHESELVFDLNEWFKKGNKAIPMYTNEERKLKKDKREALALLSKTDWMVIRFLETGEEIPKDITTQRELSRKILS